MNQLLPEKTQASSTEKVLFKDGMIVTAEDLQDAMSYPVDVFRTLVRAFFGCGIVCGLEVEKCTPETTEECAAPAPEGDSDYAVCITPGVAIDCHGYPIELCRKVTLPFPAGYCGKGYKACIAIRRMESEECPRPTDVCSSGTKDAAYECKRLREQVQVKTFLNDTLSASASICRFEADSEEESTEESCTETEAVDTPNTEESPECVCLKVRESGVCCDEAWVLLACVTVDQAGTITKVDMNGRKYVKPIACVCPGKAAALSAPSGLSEATETAREVSGESASTRRARKKTSPRRT